MPIGISILIGYLAVAALMGGLWAYAKAQKNHGYVDVAWSFGVGLCALIVAATQSAEPARGVLIAVLIAVWSGRLTIHLFTRVHHAEEDGRYQNLREKWGGAADRNFFFFYQLQATWCVLFALPVIACVLRPGPLDLYDAIGAAIWLACLFGESLADRQLDRFKKDNNNRSKLCDIGLWRWSRHPNYFFEWVIWFAYVAIGVTGPWGPVTLLGPLVMLIFLFGLTGIPATEYRSAMSRPQAYRRYRQTTSALVPWPPATKSSE